MMILFHGRDLKKKKKKQVEGGGCILTWACKSADGFLFQPVAFSRFCLVAMSEGSALLQCQQVQPSYNVSRFCLVTTSEGSALLQHQQVLPCYSVNMFCLVTASAGSALLQCQQVLPCYTVNRFLLNDNIQGKCVPNSLMSLHVSFGRGQSS